MIGSKGKSMVDYKKNHPDILLKFEKNPQNAHAINQLAISFMELNDYQEACRLFKRNAELNPSVESFTNLAYFYFTEGEPRADGEGWIDRGIEAVDLLTQVLLIKPQTPVPSAFLGEIYYELGEWVKSKEAFEFSVSVQPTYQNLHNLGSSLYQLGKIEEASMYYFKAHRMKDSNYNYLALYGFAICQIRLGLFPIKAIEELEISLDEDYTEIDLETLVNLYYELNQYDKVIKAYKDTKLYYSPDWVLPYMFALIQCNKLEYANEVMNHALLQIANGLKECDEDLDEQFTIEDRQRYRKELEAEKQAYIQGFEKMVIKALRPSIELKAQTVTKCYLFGCERHENPAFPNDF